jgi:LuxR family maltose regulon positive regulatory protein
MTSKTRPPRTPLLQSKLQPPISGRFVVPRTRLIEAVRSAQYAKLVMVRAPAGFGKTTLMAECLSDLRNQGVSTAWLTLDAADNDPVRFLTYLIAAIKKSNPGFELGGDEPDLMFAGHAPTGVFLYLLDRVSAFAGPLTLFLDDFGVIRSPEVLEIVRQLLHHLPPEKRLMIALRQVPDLGLGRLRAQGDLLEVELGDLRFTRDEAAQFIRKSRGLELDDRSVDALHRFAEGWVAGLQLSTLSPALRGNREHGDGTPPHVASGFADYLVEEVLSCQSETVQAFLLQTSVLKTLSAPLCDALTGRADANEMLAFLERENLFVVPLDEERRCFRYHSIFATFLRSRLEQRDRKRAVQLHKAACEWYAAAGDVDAAAEHALAAGDTEFAGEYLARCAFDLVRTGQAATVAVWGDRLPAQVLDRHPELQLAYAYALTVRYQYDRALDVLDRLTRNVEQSNAQVHFRRDVRCVRIISLFVNDRIDECERITREVLAEPALEGDRQTRFLPTPFTIAAYLEMTAGRWEQALRYVSKTGQLVGQTTWVMKVYGRFVAGCLYLTQGRLHEALALTSATLQEIEATPARYSGGGTAIAVLEAEILYERNDLAGAERLLLAHRAMLPTVMPDIMIVGFRTLARLQIANGQRDEAMRSLAQLERLGEDRGALRISASARQERIRMALSAGELERALVIQREHDDAAIWSGFAGRCMKGSDPETPDVTRIRLLLAQGQARKALDALKDAVSAAVEAGFFRQALLLRVLGATAHEACGERRLALRVLKEALAAAQGEGFVRTFADEGEIVSGMVQEIRKLVAPVGGIAGREDVSLEFIDRVLQATGAQNPTPAAEESTAAGAPSEALTDREIDILGKVALGFSNEDLGAQLCLSVHTVRFHLRNIYVKLGAHNRTQAVALGRRLGLIR